MTVLKVSKVSNPHSVAGAIAGLVRDTGIAVMQAIGASATNQAVKAIAIARSFMKEEGVDLLTRVGFLDVEFGGETRTALRFEIANRENFPTSETPVEASAAVGTAPRPSTDSESATPSGPDHEYPIGDPARMDDEYTTRVGNAEGETPT